MLTAVAVHGTGDSSTISRPHGGKQVAILSDIERGTAARRRLPSTMLAANDPDIKEFREAFPFSRLLPPEIPDLNKDVCPWRHCREE